MKRFILALSTAPAMLVSNAQTMPPKVFPKTIQVTGIAELSIAPDEIHVLITKAIYLAESISENIGGAITITETTFPQVFDNMKRFSNTMTVLNDEVGDLSKPEFKKLNLKAEMNVIFELR